MEVLIWITCRNYEAYLPDAYASALGQTYAGLGVEIAHDRCGLDAPIGTAANRNRALQHRDQYRYVVFLDADDVVPSGYVEDLLTVAHGDSCVVTCDAEYFGDRKGRISVQMPVTLDSLITLNTVHCSALIPMSAFAQAGGFDELLPAYEDWDLWCKLARNGVEFRHCPDTRLHYRQHAGSRHHSKQMEFHAMRRLLSERYAMKVTK